MGSTYETFRKVCKHHSISTKSWKLNAQNHFIEFVNGSRIDLIDLKYQPRDPMYEDLGSWEFTGGAIEEAGEVEFQAFDVIKSRIGRQLNDKFNIPPKILITCNPKKNWLYSMVYKPWKNGKLDKSYQFIQSLFGDNPYTASSYGKMLEEIKDEPTRQRLMFGNWEYDDSPLKLCSYGAICNLFKQQVKKGDPYLTIDPARLGADLCVCILWYGNHLEKIWTWKTSTGDFLEREIEKIISLYEVPRRNVIADAVGIGGPIVDNLRCKGFVSNYPPVQPPESKFNKYKKLNFSNLKTQCAFMLAEKIESREMSVSETKYEEDLKDELGQLQRQETEGRIKLITKDEMKKNLGGKSPGILDCCIMKQFFDLKKEYKGTDDKEFEESARKFMGVKPKSFQNEIGMTTQEWAEYQHNARKFMRS